MHAAFGNFLTIGQSPRKNQNSSLSCPSLTCLTPQKNHFDYFSYSRSSGELSPAPTRVEFRCLILSSWSPGERGGRTFITGKLPNCCCENRCFTVHGNSFKGFVSKNVEFGPSATVWSLENTDKLISTLPLKQMSERYKRITCESSDDSWIRYYHDDILCLILVQSWKDWKIFPRLKRCSAILGVRSCVILVLLFFSFKSSWIIRFTEAADIASSQVVVELVPDL